MAKLSHRVFAGFFAGLFLITSSTVAIAYIISDMETSNNSQTTSSSACSGTNPDYQAAGQKLAGFNPVAIVSQLQTTDLKVGSGEAVKPGATICANYTGALATTGVIFQSSSSPATFSLSSVINGWVEGIPGMKVGGERQLLIPADLAYGANPPSGSGIPANAPLVFNVTLKSIISN